MTDEFVYRPARRSYQALRDNLIIEIVQDSVKLTHDRRPLGSTGLITPDTARDPNKWVPSSPIVRVLSAGPDVKDPRVRRAGALLLLPPAVARSMPPMLWPDDDPGGQAEITFIINEQNIGSVLTVEDQRVVLARARGTATEYVGD